MNKSHQIIRKITLTSIMLVLNIIFNRLFMVLSITPLNKIGFADVFVLFTSIFVGPLYGCVVGGFGDLLGALILPTGDINWFLCLAKFISGALPGLLYILFSKINNQKFNQFFAYSLVASICVLVTIFINIFPTVTIWTFVFNIELWAKILFPVLCFFVSILLFVSLHMINRKYKFESNYETWSIVIIYELIFPLIINTIIKSLFFNVDFLSIFVIQLLLFIPDVIILVLFLNLIKRIKYFVDRRGEETNV